MRQVISGGLSSEQRIICDRCGKVSTNEIGWIHVTTSGTGYCDSGTAQDFCSDACYIAFIGDHCNCSQNHQHCWHDNPNGKQCCHCGMFKLEASHGPYAPGGMWGGSTWRYTLPTITIPTTPLHPNPPIWNPEPPTPWNPPTPWGSYYTESFECCPKVDEGVPQGPPWWFVALGGRRTDSLEMYGY